MSKRLFFSGFLSASAVLLLTGVGTTACVKSYSRRPAVAWTIHDCVMEKWIQSEAATGLVPAQSKELQWRRQCAQEWSAMAPKRG